MRRSFFWQFSLFSCLLMLLCSCSPTNTSTNENVTANSTSTPAQATPTIVPTETGCPANGQARAAVMPALSPGQHSGLVYAFSDDNEAFILRKYDLVSGAKTNLLNIQGMKNWYDIQLSKDGQWIIFHSPIDGKEAIQMVRLDGQELQTLYCAPFIHAASLSPDQKSFVFDSALYQGKDGYSLLRLDMATGQLHEILFLPSDNASQSTYEAVRWAGDSSLYVTTVPTSGVGGESPFCLRYRTKLFLVSDIFQDVSRQETNLQPITLADGKANGSCLDYDMNADQQVFFNVLQNNNSLVQSQSVGDGTVQTLYDKPGRTISNVRLASPQTALFTIINASYNSQRGLITPQPEETKDDGLWKVNVDGTGVTRLFPTQPGSVFRFPLFSYTPWSNVSRDGSMYACVTYDQIKPNNTLTIGSLAGDPPVTIGSARWIILAGWTML